MSITPTLLMGYGTLYLLRHTVLYDTQNLKLNLPRRAEIWSSTGHMSKYLRMSLYVSLDGRRAPNILKRTRTVRKCHCRVLRACLSPT